MRKYAALTDYLLRQPGVSVSLTMAELEEILGFELPPSAYLHKSWWGNQATAHRKAWLEAGYRYQEIHLGQIVRFTSVSGTPKNLLQEDGEYISEMGGRPCFIFFKGQHRVNQEICWVGQYLDGDMEIFIQPQAADTVEKDMEG